MRRFFVLAAAMTVLSMAAAWASAQTQPATAPTAPAATTKPTLWLIGDSTVNNSASGGLGWGAPIAKLFDPAKIAVQNKARGGRSARSYYSEKLWDEVKNQLKPGDFVLMQFGHNDGPGTAQTIASSTNGRPDLAGIGEETTQGPASSNRGEETVHTYGWYMDLYVRETKEKQATPVMLTMVPHNAWVQNDPTKLRRVAANTFVPWCQQIAGKEKIYYIDLNEISASRLEKEGRETVTAKYFTPPGDGTHTNPAGAQLNAESVVMGIRALKDLKLNEYLSEAGKKLEPADAKTVRTPEQAAAATASAPATTSAPAAGTRP